MVGHAHKRAPLLASDIKRYHYCGAQLELGWWRQTDWGEVVVQPQVSMITYLLHEAWEMNHL